MELRHLRYFCAVAENQGFSRSARLLHVSQSAISEQISDLEREIGVPLLIRGQQKIKLTPHGEIFLTEARKVLAASDRAVEMAQRSARGEIGTLTIGFFTGGTATLIPKIIRAFRRLHPGVRVSLAEMSPTVQSEALVNGTPLAPGPVDVRALAGERFVICARESSQALFDKIIALCEEASFSPRIVNTSPAWSSVVMLVQAGEGIAILPNNLQQKGTPDVAFCPLSSRTASIGLVMAWSPEREYAIQQAFLELVRDHKERLKSTIVMPACKQEPRIRR